MIRMIRITVDTDGVRIILIMMYMCLLCTILDLYALEIISNTNLITLILAKETKSGRYQGCLTGTALVTSRGCRLGDHQGAIT